MPWLDNQPGVFRYAWYWADPSSNMGAIVDSNGNPTFLGVIYGYTPY
jgi:hypothetical protein